MPLNVKRSQLETNIFFNLFFLPAERQLLAPSDSFGQAWHRFRKRLIINDLNGLRFNNKLKKDEWARSFKDLGTIHWVALFTVLCECQLGAAATQPTGRLLLSCCTKVHTSPRYTMQPKSLVAPPRCLKYPNSSGVKAHICQKIVTRNEMIKPCDQSPRSTTSSATFLRRFVVLITILPFRDTLQTQKKRLTVDKYKQDKSELTSALSNLVADHKKWIQHWLGWGIRDSYTLVATTAAHASCKCWQVAIPSDN